MHIFSKSSLHALVLMCGSMVFGATISFSSATIQYIKLEFGPLSIFEVAAFQSVPSIVAIFSPFIFSFFLHRYRRKVVSSFLGAVGAVFWLLLLSMNKKYFWLSIVIRGLHGIVLAGVSLICPMYIIEISPSDSHGFFGTLHSIAISLGHVIYNLIGVSHKWQIPIYVTVGLLIVFSGFIWLIPDSPADTKTADISEETTNNNEIRISHQKDSLFQRKYLRQILIAVGMMLFLQLDGIGAIISNVAPLMSEAGLSLDPGYQAAIATSAQLIACIISSLIMEFFGRRKMWIFSSFGSALSLLVYALNVRFGWSKWLPMIMLFSYLLFFGLGMASLPWFLVPEMFPDSVRSFAMTIATAVNWLSASIATFLFPYLAKWFGQFGLMIILMVICFLCTLFGFIFVKNSMAFTEEEQESNRIEENLIAKDVEPIDL